MSQSKDKRSFFKNPYFLKVVVGKQSDYNKFSHHFIWMLTWNRCTWKIRPSKFNGVKMIGVGHQIAIDDWLMYTWLGNVKTHEKWCDLAIMIHIQNYAYWWKLFCWKKIHSPLNKELIIHLKMCTLVWQSVFMISQNINHKVYSSHFFQHK